jgi:hypothetical protein
VANGVKQGGIMSPVLFTMYVDDLLIRLRDSGLGCRIKDEYIGAIAYADDITLICPSIRGINTMLKICKNFADEFEILFNEKKTVCIKFGNNVCTNEHIVFNGVNINWQDSVKHLGNIVNISNTDNSDCEYKSSIFIGSVNKLLSNFGTVQPDILCNLFYSYCCSLYGCQLWKFNTSCFNQLGIYWNKAVRRLFNLPYRTHSWILGPLMNKLHIRKQLYIRSIKFLMHLYTCKNTIVNVCIENAKTNSNTPLGYKFAFFRNAYGIDVTCKNVHKCISIISNSSRLSDEDKSIIDNLRNLIDVKSKHLYIEGFNIDDINYMIDTISVM